MAAEKNFETILRKYIKDNGGWSVKIHADAVQGMSTLDLLGGIDGIPFYVEVKSVDGRLSRAQTYLVNRAKRDGYASGMVSTIKEFDRLIRAQKKKRAKGTTHVQLDQESVSP